MKNTKDYIIETSTKLFMQKSFKEVTMKELVEVTGLSKGAFYHHFENKEALFEEVIKYFYDNIMITDYSGFPKTSLQDFYTAYLSQLGDDDDLDNKHDGANFLIFIADAVGKLPNFLDIHNAQRAKEIQAWTDIIKIAKQNKEINTDLPDEHIALMFLDLSDGVALNKIFTYGLDSIHDLRKDWDNLYKLLQK